MVNILLEKELKGVFQISKSGEKFEKRKAYIKTVMFNFRRH